MSSLYFIFTLPLLLLPITIIFIFIILVATLCQLFFIITPHRRAVAVMTALTVTASVSAIAGKLALSVTIVSAASTKTDRRDRFKWTHGLCHQARQSADISSRNISARYAGFFFSAFLLQYTVCTKKSSIPMMRTTMTTSISIGRGIRLSFICFLFSSSPHRRHPFSSFSSSCASRI